MEREKWNGQKAYKKVKAADLCCNRNHLKDQIEYCANRLSTNGNDIQTEIALNNYKMKLGVLMARKNNFIEAQKAYELIAD